MVASVAASAAGGAVPRTTTQLYRDCLRLIRHIAPGETSAKAVALRGMVRSEFRKPLTAAQDLEARKASAVRALSNYMLAVAAPKDEKLKSSMKDFHGRSVEQAKTVQRQTTTTVQEGDESGSKSG